MAIAASGSNTIVNGVPGQTIRILFIFLITSQGAQTIQFADGSTAFTGAMAQGLASGSPQGLVADHHDNPLIISAGNNFNIVTGTNTPVNGYIMFEQGQE